MMVAVALLIAGFMARRLMMPGAARQLSHRAPDYSSSSPQPNEVPAARGDDEVPREHLSDTDRRALDEVIRRKTDAH